MNIFVKNLQNLIMLNLRENASRIWLKMLEASLSRQQKRKTMLQTAPKEDIMKQPFNNAEKWDAGPYMIIRSLETIIYICRLETKYPYIYYFIG